MLTRSYQVPKTNVSKIALTPMLREEIQNRREIQEFNEYINRTNEGIDQVLENVKQNERFNNIINGMGEVWRDENFQRALIQYMEEMKMLMNYIKTNIVLYKEEIKSVTNHFIKNYQQQLDKILKYTKKEMRENSPESFYYYFFQNMVKSFKKIHQMISPVLRGRLHRVLNIEKTASPVLKNSISENPIWIEESVDIMKNIMMTKINRVMNQMSRGESMNLSMEKLRRIFKSNTMNQKGVRGMNFNPRIQTPIVRHTPISVPISRIVRAIPKKSIIETIVPKLPSLFRRLPK